jgi:hypothetical protein
MWVFALSWAGWSCEIASEASEVVVGVLENAGNNGMLLKTEQYDQASKN